MIGARKGGRVGARQEGSMNKKIPCGGVGRSFPYGDIFSMWAVFSLHVGAIFSVCVGGGSLFLHGGGGIIGLAPITIFAVASCCHIFYCTDIYNLSRSWRFACSLRNNLNVLKSRPPSLTPPPPPPLKKRKK